MGYSLMTFLLSILCTLALAQEKIERQAELMKLEPVKFSLKGGPVSEETVGVINQLYPYYSPESQVHAFRTKSGNLLLDFKLKKEPYALASGGQLGIRWYEFGTPPMFDKALEPAKAKAAVEALDSLEENSYLRREIYLNPAMTGPKSETDSTPNYHANREWIKITFMLNPRSFQKNRIEAGHFGDLPTEKELRDQDLPKDKKLGVVPKHEKKPYYDSNRKWIKFTFFHNPGSFQKDRIEVLAENDDWLLLTEDEKKEWQKKIDRYNPDRYKEEDEKREKKPSEEKPPASKPVEPEQPKSSGLR